MPKFILLHMLPVPRRTFGDNVYTAHPGGPLLINADHIISAQPNVRRLRKKDPAGPVDGWPVEIWEPAEGTLLCITPHGDSAGEVVVQQTPEEIASLLEKA